MVRKVILIAALGIATASLGLIGCTGGTGGGEENFDDTTFVDTDEAAGSIDLTVEEVEMPVSGVSHFVVQVLDAKGSPVPSINVICDTEKGLAIIEPSTGHEMTSDRGFMSGYVGCEQPGSYRMGCRLPSGSYKRELLSIKCTGSTPQGFVGFPGAGGGGLGQSGGGTVPTGTTGSIQVSAVTAIDNGTSVATIDVSQGYCGRTDQNGDGDTTDACDLAAEPFSDTFVKISISNATGESVNIRGYSFIVRPYPDAGDSFTSSAIPLTSGGDLAAGATGDVTAMFMNAVSVTVPGACPQLSGRKAFVGSSVAVAEDFGFRQVSFTVEGTTASGREVTGTREIGLTFGSYNRCGS